MNNEESKERKSGKNKIKKIRRDKRELPEVPVEKIIVSIIKLHSEHLVEVSRGNSESHCALSPEVTPEAKRLRGLFLVF